MAFPVRRSFLILPLLGVLATLCAAAPGKALTTVCTAGWSGSRVPAGGTASAPLTGAKPPCPSSTVTASVEVGSDANAGTINTTDAIGGSATSNFARTSIASVDIGVPANATQSLVLTFSQAVANPYLFFTYLDSGDSFLFSQPFALVQANNASKTNAATVAGTGSGNGQDDGFIVQMLGTYSTIDFTFRNTTFSPPSVAFTAGVVETPGPLPLMGAGVAFGFSRRLRRRIKA